jgi:hypothetical protein
MLVCHESNRTHGRTNELGFDVLASTPVVSPVVGQRRLHAQQHRVLPPVGAECFVQPDIL